MRRFRSVKQAHNFLDRHIALSNRSSLGRHLVWEIIIEISGKVHLEILKGAILLFIYGITWSWCANLLVL